MGHAVEPARNHGRGLEAGRQAPGQGQAGRLRRAAPDGASGTTNVCNTSSRHWLPWLQPAHRCLVPFTSFSEFNREAGGDIWFAFDESRPLACFAGIWLPAWTGVRKIRTGIETADLFAFLTTDPSEPVRSVHPKAMPAILTTSGEADAWLSAPWREAVALQRSLPSGVLRIVARGGKEDPPPAPAPRLR